MHGPRTLEPTVIHKSAAICRNPENVLEFYGDMEWAVLNQSYPYIKGQGGLSAMSSEL